MNPNSNSTRRRIFCHRGLWRTLQDQNSLSALNTAEANNFSQEVDLRFDRNSVYLSHEPIRNISEVTNFDSPKFKSRFALNIKTDGLAKWAKKNKGWILDTDSFFFDGSLAEMYKFKLLKLPHALRLSEFELALAWDCKIIWLDSFTHDWWITNLKIDENKEYILVSPEIHGRNPENVWQILISNWNTKFSNFSICTDRPLDFLKYVS